MSGKRLGCFRAGDRSEYLALYGLSRVAFVDPFPRQEDFGVVDFLAILTRAEGRFVYPESAFFVQVKSKKEDFFLEADAIRWVTHHMDHPLFLCVCDKQKNELALYSTSRIWLALFKKVEPTTITLKLDSNLPEQDHVEYNSGGQHIDVHLGAAILRQDLATLEESPKAAFDVLHAWIRLDAENIARRRLGRIAVRCFADWTTNEVPNDQTLNVYYHGPNYSNAERAVVPLLTALAQNYIRFNEHKKLAAVREMLSVLEPLLDDRGRQIVNR